MGLECTDNTLASRGLDIPMPACRPPRQHIELPDTGTLLKFKARQAINRVMATYLGSLEEVSDEHDEAMRKLIDALPESLRVHVMLADHFGEARFEAIRKHVLKAGNDALREWEDQTDVLLASKTQQTLQ